MPKLTMTYVTCVLLLIACIVMGFLGYWKRAVPIGLIDIVLLVIMYRKETKGGKKETK